MDAKTWSDSGDFHLENTDSPTIRRPTESAPLFLLGIGAYADRLEAIEPFFEHMLVNSGMALVLIQYIFPDFKCLMSTLLLRHADSSGRERNAGCI